MTSVHKWQLAALAMLLSWFASWFVFANSGFHFGQGTGDGPVAFPASVKATAFLWLLNGWPIVIACSLIAIFKTLFHVIKGKK